MATSIRNTAESCLDVSGRISIRKDVFGYIWGPIKDRPARAAAGLSVKRSLSVKRHLELIKGTAFNLSIFLVGHEPDFSGEFTNGEILSFQTGVYVMREIYAKVNLGIRNLYWLRIPVDEIDGHDVVDFWESTTLTSDFSGDNDGIDLFVVSWITDAAGWSIVNGPCDKNAWFVKTGAVMELGLSDTSEWLGVLMAHEVGHYLGLEGGNDINNVMGDDDDDDGIDTTNSGSTGVTLDQGDIMKSHCSIRSSC